MRLLAISLLSLFTFAFQITFMQQFVFFNTIPNLILILTISYSVLRNEIEGCILGFLLGLAFDVFFSLNIGINAFLFCLVGYYSTKPFNNFYKNGFLGVSTIVLVSTLIIEYTNFFYINLFRGEISFISYTTATILPVATYNIMITPLIYKIIFIINNLIEKNEKRKRKIFNSI